MSKDKKQFWIVWNEARNEGFVTDEIDDARGAATGEWRGLMSTVGMEFFEAYEDDAPLVIEPVLLPKEPKA